MAGWLYPQVWACFGLGLWDSHVFLRNSEADSHGEERLGSSSGQPESLLSLHGMSSQVLKGAWTPHYLPLASMHWAAVIVSLLEGRSETLRHG